MNLLGFAVSALIGVVAYFGGVPGSLAGLFFAIHLFILFVCNRGLENAH